MSDIMGVKCDRCGERTLLPVDGTSVRGWGWLQLGRTDPFRKTEVKDICDECFEEVYRFATTMPAPVIAPAVPSGLGPMAIADAFNGTRHTPCLACAGSGNCAGATCRDCGGAGFVAK